MARKRFIFTITLFGEGETADEAWGQACEGFSEDPGEWDRVTEEPIGDEPFEDDEPNFEYHPGVDGPRGY